MLATSCSPWIIDLEKREPPTLLTWLAPEEGAIPESDLPANVLGLAFVDNVTVCEGCAHRIVLDGSGRRGEVFELIFELDRRSWWLPRTDLNRDGSVWDVLFVPFPESDVSRVDFLDRLGSHPAVDRIDPLNDALVLRSEVDSRGSRYWPFIAAVESFGYSCVKCVGFANIGKIEQKLNEWDAWADDFRSVERVSTEQLTWDDEPHGAEPPQ